MSVPDPLPSLSRLGHAGHVKRCLHGLPDSQVDLDSSRLALAFYCIGSLDLLGMLQSKTSQTDRESWREWIWEQYARGEHGSGFRSSPFMTSSDSGKYEVYDRPHVIMTYTALMTLAILRDDFTRLDRSGVITFLKACQREDGSFSTIPNGVETDLRSVYCAFAISYMLNDWSGVDIDRAMGFVASCRTYEGGYGQAPFCEAQGGTTYTALAAIYLAGEQLNLSERQTTVRWLVQNQDAIGGFRGRTNKEADACYCFWCSASLQILGGLNLVNAPTLRKFIAQCQFKFGGIGKAPGERPDPYHTYLSLAALSMTPAVEDVSWTFEPLDPLLNARAETSAWARKHIPMAG